MLFQNRHRDFPRVPVVRSVRDRINLVLIKKYKKKMADDVKASGIAVELLSEFDRAMEEICDKADASEKDQSDLEQQKKDKTASDRKIAQEMRIKAMQTMTKTKKRVNADDELENNEKPLQKRGRRSGSDTMLYLKEKSDKDFKLKQEELELRKQEQLAQAKQHTEFTQHLVRQQEKQQDMLEAFQRQQQQQMQQFSQMQLNLLNQQQQQSQALLAVLQTCAAEK